ncbi:LysR family transcriptional regulator [Ponticoccus sp. SC2-23]|uniref:LysR family transcriptional regulator n=1 Tax=Alexandriicola marinus TaxID=2081710 RepID=UPI000FDC8FA8|nr:LysR family transcriptional regulator [Alexandriicola marinus]MBM1218641.1 LysR family transcriptional regulator [Ponticoccus sp. SC6-9]MBM1224287.1 LysR family transcriptional regulator [Ponticoccus sp. SC6-15]MBM1229934.1 LysR family transcriptional regulator [Ponticoccus sp. SC6-38]MBM1233253.1 LysR family transcriptional regulator [Ponticoccus sp. SC6-45]MBM1236797.1 LysR family transcriptional regulator [Ponticoccus sp. SC6-49]MBM1242264.1 LysR family transcriptional regulator [Pontic
MDNITFDFEAGLAEQTDSAPRKAVLSMTLHQLRIFHAVANANTMTSAAKQLGLTQPSLSQQLGRLEAAIDARLFYRRPNEMELTEAGRYLLPRVEQLLRILNETEEGLTRFSDGQPSVVKLAGLDSLLRNLLPGAVRRLHDRHPDISIDVQESAPADILEMLDARRINFGLVAANSLAQTHEQFLQIPVMEDPYVLAVPADLDLAGIVDPVRELSSSQFRTLNQSIQFAFGSTHTRRVSNWYDRLLPGHQTIVQCRSYESALSFVRAGTGVCVAPALSTIGAAGPDDKVRRYLIKVPPRRIVALLLSHHRSMEPMATLIAALQEVGRSYEVPRLLPVPPFLAKDAVPSRA